VLLIASANIWLGNWTGAIVILLQLALLFRARACKQIAIEAFAAVLIVVPLFYVYQGAVLVDSYRFTTLPLFAKLSVISAFAQLWLWSAYYRKYYADSALRFVAEAARILFYMLIPICWVGSVVRRFDEVSIILLWLSPLLALFFARKIGHHLLIKETKILTGLASIGFIAANVSDKLSSLNVFAALVGFSAFYVISYLLNRKNEAPIYQFICSWGVVSLGIAVPAIVGFQTNSLLYGLVFASAYWSLAFSCIHTSSHLNRNEIFITASALILVLVSWVLIPSSFGYALMPTIFLLSTMYQKEARFKRSKLNDLFKTHGDLFLHSVLAVTYVVLLYSLTEYRVELLIAPVLAIHGALILFLKDRRLTTVKYAFALMSLGIVKLAFIDAANALLWQKVILFMGIGVFILGASFWYQKLISGTQSQTIDVHN
jgi:hypothetical protein